MPANDTDVTKKVLRKKVDGEAGVLATIAEMDEPNRTISERLHALVKANAPQLSPKLWYGMPILRP